MNCLTLRDQLFSDLHRDALKPIGFKKKGHWIKRDFGDLIHAFYLRASRYGSQSEAVFWIDVKIFSADWHRLVFPELPFKGPTEGPCLITQDLGNWCTPILTTLHVAPDTDLGALQKNLSNAVTQHALPYLTARQSTETLLGRLISEPSPHNRDALSIVGLSRLLGLEAQAQKYMINAKLGATHENDLRFLELRERNIWRDG